MVLLWPKVLTVKRSTQERKQNPKTINKIFFLLAIAQHLDYDFFDEVYHLRAQHIKQKAESDKQNHCDQGNKNIFVVFPELSSWIS